MTSRLTGPAAAQDANVTAALSSGKPLVLVVRSDGKRIRASEAYEDWQSYLQSFVKESSNEMPVHMLTRTRYQQIVLSPRLKSEFATLFVAAGHEALVHDGMVLEPQVYEIGRSFMRNGIVPPEAAQYGLAAAKLKLQSRGK